MGRYFQTADYKPTIDFLYEPDWALTERVLKTEQDSLDAQREQIEAWKNLQIEHLGGAADAENSKRILDYIRNVADEYSNAIESDKLDARAYTPNLKNFQNELLKNYREGDIARIQSSPAALRAWEKEHEKFKESHPEYYAHARQKFLNDYHSSGGNSLVRGWQGQALARPIDVEKVTQHAYKLMAEKTGWTRDSTDGTWINSNGHKVESLEANRVFQNIMGTILADPANQAFMRQSTELGWMRYLDDKGNIDYNSPGLNPYNSIAQSISYENRQTDHSMRANDYGKMKKQHEYDIAMENLRHKNAKALKKFKKELEEPPITEGVTTIPGDKSNSSIEEAINNMNNGTPEQKQIAETNLRKYIGEEFAKLGYDVNGKDKTFVDSFITHVGTTGLIDNSIGKSVEHFNNKYFKGQYRNNQQVEAIKKEGYQKVEKLLKERDEANRRFKNGEITKERRDEIVKRVNDDKKKVLSNVSNLLSFKDQKYRTYRDGTAPEYFKSGENVSKLKYKNINDEGFNKMSTNDSQLKTITVGKSTSSYVLNTINANQNSIKAIDLNTGDYINVNDVLKGEVIQTSVGRTASGDRALDIKLENGSIRKVQIRADNPAVDAALGKALFKGVEGKTNPDVAVQLTRQGQEATTYFSGLGRTEGKDSNGALATTTLGSESPIAIISNGGKFKVMDLSNGKQTLPKTQQEIKNTFDKVNSPVYSTPQEALYSTYRN